jgi:hypothetical protein
MGTRIGHKNRAHAWSTRTGHMNGAQNWSTRMEYKVNRLSHVVPSSGGSEELVLEYLSHTSSVQTTI